MVDTEINVKTDSKWFKYLIEKKSYLPSEALRKIEHDKLRNIPPEMPREFSLNLRENWWSYTAFGLIGFGILYLRFRNK